MSADSDRLGPTALDDPAGRPAPTEPAGHGALLDLLAAAVRAVLGKQQEPADRKAGQRQRTADDASTTVASASARPRRTGVIFVHGIGSQQPGETLLQWSTPLIEILTAWKRSVADPGSILHDPVETAHMDFESPMPTITLAIPAHRIGAVAHPPATWILTEAWWAAKVTPPRLSTMTSWLGSQGGAQQIVDAILGNRPDGSRMASAAKFAVIPFVGVLAGLILTLYALVRGITSLIPIQAVKDAAVFRVFDEFLTGWFGDVRVLLFDPAQSANIRGGLARGIARFHEMGVDSVVIVAHSGGAMVSYLTLTDPAHLDLKVDKLITFGEGWNLAVTLTPDDIGMADRLRRDITDLRPGLLWRDYWGSHDPAPAGRVKVEAIGSGGASHQERVDSRMVWNRRSLLDDHGTYFDNDEEFTIPVLGEIDAPHGSARDSRFYPGPEPNADPALPPADPRARRHRERVAVLALWRHLALTVPIAVIAATLADPRRLSDLGAAALDVVSRIPLINDLVLKGVGPFVVDAVRSIRPADFTIGSLNIPWTAIVSGVGLATLQAIVLISMLQLIASPVEAYQAWPVRSWRRRLFLAIEWAVIGLLIASLVPLVILPLLRQEDHGQLLGSGAAWIGGIGLTIGTLVVAVVGHVVAREIRSSARLFGVAATGLFVFAMLCAVRAIFERPHLETGEIGYFVIWAGFLLLYRFGHDRWSQWDRVERHAAYRADDAIWTSRRPVWVSIVGFVLAGGAVAAAILAWWPTDVTTLLAVAAATLIVGAILGGSLVSWRQSPNDVIQPPAVESARGRV